MLICFQILPVSDLDGERFVCPVCKEVMISQMELTKHIRSHNSTAAINANTCTICGKVLSSQSSLDRHMLVHSGERPFKCKICKMAFTTNGNMHRHMRIHEKELENGTVRSSKDEGGPKPIAPKPHRQNIDEMSFLSNSVAGSKKMTAINIDLIGSKRKLSFGECEDLDSAFMPIKRKMTLSEGDREMTTMTRVEPKFSMMGRENVMSYTINRGYPMSGGSMVRRPVSLNIQNKNTFKNKSDSFKTFP